MIIHNFLFYRNVYMIIHNFCIQPWNVTISNLNNTYISLHFNFISLFNKPFINFLRSLKDKSIIFNKFRGKVLNFKCKRVKWKLNKKFKE